MKLLCENSNETLSKEGQTKSWRMTCLFFLTILLLFVCLFFTRFSQSTSLRETFLSPLPDGKMSDPGNEVGLPRRNLKTALSVHSESASNVFRSRRTEDNQRPFWISVVTCEENWGRKSHDYRDVIIVVKAPILKCFPSTLKRTAGVFKFLQFEGSCQIAPFS